MKTIQLLSVLALAAASTAFASTSIDRPAALQAPVPVTVVHPTELNQAYRNYQATVSFVIDTEGRVHDVQPVGDMPRDLQARLLPAVAQWTFKPSTNAKGQLIERHVVLPLKLVDGGV